MSIENGGFCVIVLLLSELAGEYMMPISNIAQSCTVFFFFFVFLVCVEINSLSQFQYFKPVLGSVHMFLEVFDA